MLFQIIPKLVIKGQISSMKRKSQLKNLDTMDIGMIPMNNNY